MGIVTLIGGVWHVAPISVIIVDENIVQELELTQNWGVSLSLKERENESMILM